MKKNIFRLSLFFILVLSFFYIGASRAMAAQFSQATIRYDRMMTGKPTSLLVILVPATVGTEAKIKLVFPGALNMTAVPTAVGVTQPGGIIAMPGSLVVAGSGTSMMVTGLTDLTVGTSYAMTISVGFTTPAAGAYSDSVTTLTSGDAVIDSTTVTSRVITNDQVVITANVPPTFTFILTGNTDAFTTDLSSGSVVSTYGIGLTVSTNAPRGWTGWVKSANAALSSVSTGETIPTVGSTEGSVSTCTAGTDCYVLSVGVTKGSGAGTLTANPEYAGNGTSTGGTLSKEYYPFASQTKKVSNDLIVFKALVAIVGDKAAGSDYTDTWTIVGAGNF